MTPSQPPTPSPSSDATAADPAASPSTTPPAAGRRRLLFAGVAGAAGLAGASFAWWKFRPHDVAPGAEQALWGLQFDTPEGGTLDMRRFAGKPLLINFWATWCPPCVDELPLLNTFYRTHSAHGWQVVGLAIDQPSSVRQFLTKLPLDFPVGLAGLSGTDLGRSLGNLTGGLPFTVVVNAAGQIQDRKMGQVTAKDLEVWAKG
ncbi:TlpA disulfide reductase family protein [Acidovorax lacteus]|uniref:Thioredoxin domain-containing protein n=1 Tax=Acidovorax lacteus TaxID=1924988 RepID=A0ABP8KX48_9BURK